jgi:hypothetical protein
MDDRIWRAPMEKRKHWLPSRSEFIVDGKEVKTMRRDLSEKA